MTLPRLALALVLGSTTLAGCAQDIQFSDTIDLEFDLLRRSDSLHTPYVVGAEFSLCADSAREGQLRGMSLRASDPDLLEVGPTEIFDDEDHMCAPATALASGDVTLEVVDDGDVVASVDLEIRAPDRAELWAAGPLLVTRSDLDAQTEQPQILAGGTATFQVRYFAGQTPLHGQGALRVESTEALSAEAVGTVLFEDREWLRITPHSDHDQDHEQDQAGTATLELATPAGSFQTLTVEVVAEEAIADVALHGSDEQGREAGDPLVVYAQAYDEDDAPIYGVEYEWSLDGHAEPGTGDLFRYDFDPSRREELVARHGDLDALAEISAGEGEVDPSNDVGCSMGGRSGGAWALLLLGVAGLRRRPRGRRTRG